MKNIIIIGLRLFWKKATDFYHLEKLSPACQVYFAKDDSVIIPSGLMKLLPLLKQLKKAAKKT
jgi:hypothetical protein